MCYVQDQTAKKMGDENPHHTIGACPRKDGTMDHKRSVQWAVKEENWSFRRQFGQKPEANIVRVEVSMS